MAYTSLFKQSDVRITTTFSSTHKGIDLSRGVVEQPIYFPTKAVSGEVWKILEGYSSGGVYYNNAPIIYIKHQDGSGSRYIHSYPKNVKVKVGDKVVVGQQICNTGNSGNSNGDHLHFEWLTKWDDLNTRVDPSQYVISDNSIMKIGDNVKVGADTNVRTSPSTSGKVTGVALTGSVGKINDGPRMADGYEWWDVYFSNGGGWMANVGGDRLTVTTESVTNLDPAPVEPPQPPEQTECEKEVERLKGLIEGFIADYTALQGEYNMMVAQNRELGAEIKRLMAIHEENGVELSDLQEKYDLLAKERDRLEVEKNEAIKQLHENGGLAGATTGEIFAELWARITRSIK